ncbi:hypothetical protein BRAS3843_1650003 [Bradyrhizobium sp. STM 3843]|nr:hypothetical protein BRAS3843_1650003 [Bradyrhizobium sp. STM 3843]
MLAARLHIGARRGARHTTTTKTNAEGTDEFHEQEILGWHLDGCLPCGRHRWCPRQ